MSRRPACPQDARVKSTALLLSLTLLANGCSLLIVRPPRPSGAAGPGGCTTSKVAPTVDTIFAGAQAFGIVIAATASEDSYKGAALTRETTILIAALLGLVGASSAIYGFRAVDECRGSGEYVNPYAPLRQRKRTSEQRAAEEAAEEAAVQARVRARAAQAAETANAAEVEAPIVTPVSKEPVDGGRD